MLMRQKNGWREINEQDAQVTHISALPRETALGIGVPMDLDGPKQPRPRVFVLLSTFNGSAYLDSQLASLSAQTYDNWRLYWRHDGSDDATTPILTEFGNTVGEDRSIRILEPTEQIGPAASFMALLRAVVPLLEETDTVAFMDQDDVWLPQKLSRALTALSTAGTRPALYCARLTVVDSLLRCLGETKIAPHKCGFPASLTQNIAVGCTIMLNRRAAELIATSVRPHLSMHDWWCYIVVTAADGSILIDDAPVALYRQHGNNAIGVPLSTVRRAIAAWQRGPTAFMDILRQHVNALVSQPALLSYRARPITLELHRALQGGLREKLVSLGLPGLRRQRWLETLLFRLWFLIG
jgi:glycosyltransferase involved in cell wall biosynthesis